MDSDRFRLSDDDTMRRLKAIAQAPGELQWRLELLSTLERMRIQQEVTSNGILQELKRVKSAQITRTELAQIINIQIKEKTEPERKDVNRLWKGATWLLEKFASVGIAVVVALLAVKGFK